MNLNFYFPITGCISVLCTVLRRIAGVFLTWARLIDFYNGDGACLERCTDWVLKLKLSSKGEVIA